MKYKTFAIAVLQIGGLLLSSDSLSQVERDDGAADLIVSELRYEGETLVLEIQNQGPGRAFGTVTVSVHGKGMRQPRSDVRKEIQLQAPQAMRATTVQRIPLADFGIPANDEFSAMFQVTLDTKNAVSESREDNNSFSRQLDRYKSGRKIDPPRATYTNDGPLPDLLITDIVHDGPYVKVKYRNASTGATGADFLIKIEANGKSFDGNSYYRFGIPPGNTDAETGGFTLGLVGIEQSSQNVNEVFITATIDWENRVRESDESNNQFSKRVRIGPEGASSFSSNSRSIPAPAITRSSPPPSPPPSSAPARRISKDVTLVAPDENITLVIPNSDVGVGYFKGGSRHEYFRRELPPNEITIRDGCRLKVFVKEMLEHETSPDYRKEHYFISQYLGTTPSNDMCQRFNYVRRVDAQKLLQLFGLTLKDVGANPNGPQMAYVSSYPKSSDEPVLVNIGRARLEVTVVDEPKIVVKLLSVTAAQR